MVKMEFSDTLMIGSRLGVIWTLRIFYTIFFQWLVVVLIMT